MRLRSIGRWIYWINSCPPASNTNPVYASTKSEEAARIRRLMDWQVSQSDRQVSAEIIECCRQGDRVAFHALYQAYKDKVY